MPGVGLDLLDIERFERALERRPGLAQRLFTDEELGYAEARARPGLHLAARFCAKEAVAKALGLTGWSFRDVEVVAITASPCGGCRQWLAEFRVDRVVFPHEGELLTRRPDELLPDSFVL